MHIENIDFSPIPEDQILGKECRFAVYVPPPSPDHPDMHYIKEIIHTKDGRTIPNERMEFDREFPVWITKKGFRNHNQHKEWELLSRLSEYRSTERAMDRKIAAALEMPWLRDMQQCLKQPYVYGVDITSTARVKHAYGKLFKQVTGYSIMELDIESDVVYDTDRPTMVTIFMPPAHGKPARCHTIFTEHYVHKTGMTPTKYLEKFEEATQEILVPLIKTIRDTSEEKFNFQLSTYPIEFSSEVVVDDMAMWLRCFELAHQWQPDFLSIWNMEYEMKKLLESCERYGVDPMTFMCDPRVPVEYRYFNYVQGKAQKVTASGKKMPIKPAARWHYVEIPATFFIIDQMCSYKQTRMGQQEETSYGLDAIQTKEIHQNKLHLAVAEHVPFGTIDWHEYMQKNEPVYYGVYNRFDCIGPAFIDEKVKDLSHVLPSMAGTSDFKKFPSQPRRTCDALHWYLLELEEPRVMGVTSKSMVDDYDDQTISREDWIITLPAATITEDGLQVIEELPNESTRIYGHVGDLDVSASYPHGEVALNTSKETTVRELIEIEGIAPEVSRMENMGISAGHVNAVPWCMNMLGFPTHEQMMAAFKADHPQLPLKVSFEAARADMHGEWAENYPIPEGLAA